MYFVTRHPLNQIKMASALALFILPLIALNASAATPRFGDFENSSGSPYKDVDIKTETVSISQGVSADEFSWSVNSSSTSNAMLSSLSFRELDIETTSLTLDLNHLTGMGGHTWEPRVSFIYGEVKNGFLEDLDYDASNGSVTTKSTADLKGSSLFEGQIGFARYLSSTPGSDLQLELGFQWLSDQFEQTNGVQYVSRGISLEAPRRIDNLNSRYTSHWAGPFAGLSKTNHWANQSLEMGLQFQTSVYYATGQWNLRSDLAQPKSFDHLAFGAGLKLQGQHIVQLSDNVSLHQTASFGYQTTAPGRDRVYLADGSESDTTLNPMKREALSYNLGLVWQL